MNVCRSSREASSRMSNLKLSRRMAALLQVNLSDLLMDEADPQDAVAHYLSEMDEGIAQAKDAVAAAIAQQRQLEKQVKATQVSSAEWDAKTDALLKAGDEEQARRALRRKMAYERVAEDLQKKLDHQQQVVAEMKASVAALQDKAKEARRAKSDRSGRKTP